MCLSGDQVILVISLVVSVVSLFIAALTFYLALFKTGKVVVIPMVETLGLSDEDLTKHSVVIPILIRNTGASDVGYERFYVDLSSPDEAIKITRSPVQQHHSELALLRPYQYEIVKSRFDVRLPEGKKTKKFTLEISYWEYGKKKPREKRTKRFFLTC